MKYNQYSNINVTLEKTFLIRQRKLSTHSATYIPEVSLAPCFSFRSFLTRIASGRCSTNQSVRSSCCLRSEVGNVRGVKGGELVSLAERTRSEVRNDFIRGRSCVRVKKLIWNPGRRRRRAEVLRTGSSRGVFCLREVILLALKMSVHVAEKKGSALKSTNGPLITGMDNNEENDWQNGQNLLVVTQDATQSKELIGLADNQTINVALDTYCSYIHFLDIFFLRKKNVTVGMIVDMTEIYSEYFAVDRSFV